MLYTIDPGLRHAGKAIFEDGKLLRAELIRNPLTEGRGPAAWHDISWAFWKQTPFPVPADMLVCEMPRVYPGVRAEDPNDLLDLAGVLGAVVSSFPGIVRMYFPSDWKGQVPKKTMTERIRGFVKPEEWRRIADDGAKTHNTLDAVGLGLFHLGRMKRGGA
jgi:hypothetical protein